jgi:hypothetical protein
VDTGTLYYLLAGVVAVVVVGRLLAYSGKRYLTDASSGPGQAGSVAALVSVLFHLVTLGMVALFAAIPFGDDPNRTFLIRIGLVLILVGIAYAIALRMLTRRKQEAVVSDYDAQVREMRQEAAQRQANEFEAVNDPSAGVAPAPQPRPDATLREPRSRA